MRIALSLAVLLASAPWPSVAQTTSAAPGASLENIFDIIRNFGRQQSSSISTSPSPTVTSTSSDPSAVPGSTESTTSPVQSGSSTVAAVEATASTIDAPPLPTNTATRDPNTFILSNDWDVDAEPQVREFNFEIGTAAANPDGYTRQVYTINGQFPAPLIEANTGDTIVAHVKNSLPDGQTIHWHGITQNGSNHMDGVPGVTQCPIPPGGTFTYKFEIIEQYGTYWYHSHFGNTMADGIVGPLIIHSKDEPLKRGQDYDEERILIVTDWMHDQSADVVKALKSPEGFRGSPAAPRGDSILINGIGQTNCSSIHYPKDAACEPPAWSEMTLPANKKVRIRIINSAAHTLFRISLDEHEFDVVEADTDPINAVTIRELPIAPAQRYSIIVSTDVGEPGDKYWLRLHAAIGCLDGVMDPQTAQGIIRYAGEDGAGQNDTSEPTTQPWDDLAAMDAECRDLDELYELHPMEVIDAYETPSETRVLSSQFGTFLGAKGQNITGFAFNNVTFQNQIYNPVLSQVEKEGNFSSPYVASIEFTTSSYADIVINNLDGFLSHPYHLHGNEFQLIARGDGNVTAEEVEAMGLQIANPLRRDTIFIPANTYAVLRVKMDNPGVWAVHCHIGWHLAVGKLATIIVRPDDIRNFEQPDDWKGLCTGHPDEEGPARRSISQPPPTTLESRSSFSRSLKEVKNSVIRRQGPRDV
ncbi:hypothetical protein I316_02236 [Kwoniella heveanensis BCC8398]|uniref:Laccase n=1 Tax=Kwoniella heveanensis BCC8398 TaxID=1296120 RepID=A0A1B9GXK7_9TREE|nr:hypothetical protein I316_02236 [Kwoniella heveanensis BCC8398]